MTNTQEILDGCTQKAKAAFPAGGVGCSSQDAALYLAHVEAGESMRALAGAKGVHPSTVMRAVRRVEGQRDDPLFDGLLDQAAQAKAPSAAPDPDEAEVRRAAKRFLRRLSEPGAFLLVKPGAEKGGIFCAANEHRKPIALIAVRMAAEFVRRDWVVLQGRGAASLRYKVTDAGRSALKRILAEEHSAKAAAGFAEAPTPFQAQHQLAGERLFMDAEGGKPQARTVNLGESPLGWLARRKGPDGQPFLTPDEVEAGERLRQDFEIAQIGPSVAQDWRKFLTPGGTGALPSGPAEGPAAARQRVIEALSGLGSGLSDVALRVCCFLEGLEACERRMGWAARSGKVVLKIALQRLSSHYGLTTLRP